MLRSRAGMVWGRNVVSFPKTSAWFQLLLKYSGTWVPWKAQHGSRGRSLFECW